MIYTLTTNPAVNTMNMCTNSIERKIVNRTHDVVYSPNGKGLNVRFVLKHFENIRRYLIFWWFLRKIYC